MMRKDAGAIVATITTCEFRYVFLALGIFTLNTATLACRLKVVFHGENIHVSFLSAVQLTLMGYFFNNFMPTAVGGDLVKAHLVASDNASDSRVRSYASVMMDRLIGLYSFLIVAGAALLVDKGRFRMQSVKQIVFTLLLIGVVIFITVTNKKVAVLMENIFMRIKLGKLGEKLDSIYKIVHDYRNRMDVVIKALVISMVSQSVYFITIYTFFLALGSDISLGNIFLVMPVVTFISMIPSIGGLGVREGAIVAFFSPLTAKDTAFAVSILLLFGLFFISMIGGAVYLYWTVFRKNGRSGGSPLPADTDI